MPKIMLLFCFIFVACSHAPQKEYRWVSLSEKGYTENHLEVPKTSAQEFKSIGGFTQLKLYKKPLPEKSAASVRRIVLIGDTGCRLKETPYGERYQNCKDPQQWPYPALINQVLAEQPDLIIHLGDYNYREDCSEGKKCRQYTEVIGQGWRAWEADFFAPSAPALQKVPWLFVRGNHEDCRRGHEGFALLSEQGGHNHCLPHGKTDFIHLGDLLVVHLDTATLTDREESPEVIAFWQQRFKEIDQHLTQLATAGTTPKQVWLLTHRPIAALVVDYQKGLSATNRNLQKAFLQSGLAPKVDLLIGGHLHSSQLLTAEGFPRQIVAGHSGTSLDKTEEFKDLKKILNKKVDTLRVLNFQTDTHTEQSFGYAVLSKTDTTQWKIEFKNLHGATTYESHQPLNLKTKSK